MLPFCTPSFLCGFGGYCPPLAVPKACFDPAAMLTTTKTVLSAPLPRVYEESANGKAVPVSTPPPGPIGGGFQQEDLGRISKETVIDNTCHSTDTAMPGMSACSGPEFPLTLWAFMHRCT